jgi:phosphoribosyl 1,2-cyclic phosphodiesterase
MGATFEKVFRDQMSHHYFPVEIMDMSAKLDFHQVSGAFEAGPAKVTPFYTNHPGVCMAYRFDFPHASVVYLTDHENHQGQSDTELSIKQDKAILEFCMGTDLLIADSQYNDEEYQFKRGWGHSRWKDSLALGVASGAKRLAFFHHEPMRSDDHIDAVVREARERLRAAGSKLDCFAAEEGLEIPL